MNTIVLSRNLMLGCALGCMTIASQAAAQQENVSPQEAGGQIEEIIVTAQKRAENLQDVPIALTVVGAEALTSAGVSNVTNLPMVTPALTITTAGGGYMLPRIRGVGQSGTTLGLENPVAVYVDGVYYASPAGSLFSLNNIAQVAVLKGPQGTLFGRNATGGLIQVTTLDPSKQFGGKVSATIGNHETYGGSLYLTGGVASGVAADLAVYYYNQSDGFGTNLVNGKDVNDSEDIAARSKIKASLGDATTVTLSADYSRNTASKPAFRPTYDSLHPNREFFTGGKFDVSSDLQPYNRTEQAGTSLTIDHDFEAVRLTLISAYRWTHFDIALDNDRTPAPTTYFVPAAQNTVEAGQIEQTFSQELQLTSQGTGPLTWTAGLYYFQLKGKYDPPVNITTLGGFPRIVITATPKTESYAAYAQATYAVTDALNLTAGLRWTKEKRTGDGTLSVFVGPNRVNYIESRNTFEIDRPTWRLSLDYRMSDEALAYLSYNRGFKSGGFNPTEIPYNAFQPERIDAYEAGLKLDLIDRRLRLNPSVFYYDYTSLQASIFVDGLLRTQNAATAEIYGLDLDFQAAVTNNFTLTGGLSYLHHRYGLYRNAQISTPNTVTGGNTLTSADIRGTRLSNTPDWTLNLGAEYRIPMGDNELTLNANYAYNDGFYNDPENRQRQKAYSLFNASARLDLSETYSVSAWARNIGNTAYAVQLVTNSSGDGLAVGAGRTFGLTFGVNF